MDCEKINFIQEKDAVTVVFGNKIQIINLILRLSLKLFISIASIGLPIRINSKEAFVIEK